MKIVAECKFSSTLDTTKEIVTNVTVGYLEGATVTTRCVNENVTFTDIYVTLSGKEICGKDILGFKFSDKAGCHDVKFEGGRVAIDISSSYSYDEFVMFVRDLLNEPDSE